MRGPFTKVGNVPDDSVFSWPNLLIAELFVFVLTVAVILVLSLLFNAPLEQPVNVMHPPNPAKAPWYFLGLQEMVSYSAFWGGVGIPAIDFVSCCCWFRISTAGRRASALVRARAAAGQHPVPHVRRGERDSDRDRHLLPRRELGVRVPW